MVPLSKEGGARMTLFEQGYEADLNFHATAVHPLEDTDGNLKIEAGGLDVSSAHNSNK